MNTVTLARRPTHRLDLGLRTLLQRLLHTGVAASAAPASRRLPRGTTEWISRPLGRTVCCEQGTLWLTFDHQPLDVVLEAGESHHCARTTRLAIHALADARVTVR